MGCAGALSVRTNSGHSRKVKTWMCECSLSQTTMRHNVFFFIFSLLWVGTSSDSDLCVGLSNTSYSADSAENFIKILRNLPPVKAICDHQSQPSSTSTAPSTTTSNSSNSRPQPRISCPGNNLTIIIASIAIGCGIIVTVLGCSCYFRGDFHYL